MTKLIQGDFCFQKLVKPHRNIEKITLKEKYSFTKYFCPSLTDKLYETLVQLFKAIKNLSHYVVNPFYQQLTSL